MTHIKLPKDARQSVRYSSELYEKLKDKGWTIQKLLDWAIDQQVRTKLDVKWKKS